MSRLRGALGRNVGNNPLVFNDFSHQGQRLKFVAGLHLAILALCSPLLLSSPVLSLVFAGGILSVMVVALTSSKPEMALGRDSYSKPEHGVRHADMDQETRIDTVPTALISEPDLQAHAKIQGGALTFARDDKASPNLGITPSPTGQVSTAALADLMARVSHELRTPLNAVIGFSDLMEAEAFGPLGSPRYQEYSRHIRDSGKALLKSAEDTLAMTSALADPTVDTGLRAVGLATTISEAWQFLDQDVSRKALSLNVSDLQDVDVLSTCQSLRQIILNLLSEAISRAAEGATVSVFAKARGERVEFQISVSQCCDTAPDAQTRTQKEAQCEPGISRGGALDSLAVCVARALLELQGTSLLEMHDAETGWRSITILDQVVQDDFFTTPQISTAH